MTENKRRISPGHTNYNPFGLVNEIEEMFNTATRNSASSYPPYNIAKINDSNYFIEIACAGVKRENIEITKDNNVLFVEGFHEKKDEDATYLVKGLANRKFRVQYDLAEFMLIEKITYINGILKIFIKRSIPDEKKPIKFRIE